jgi:flavin-binding protein dodecin
MARGSDPSWPETRIDKSEKAFCTSALFAGFLREALANIVEFTDPERLVNQAASPAASRNLNAQERTMSIAKNSEITAASKKSFEDAIQSGIKRFSKTVDNVEGAWVKEQKIKIEDGEVAEYRVTLIVTFILKD